MVSPGRTQTIGGAVAGEEERQAEALNVTRGAELRCNGNRLRTRKGNDYSDRFSELVGEVHTMPDDVSFDGEPRPGAAPDERYASLTETGRRRPVSLLTTS